MKKILTVILSMMLVICSVTAIAEENVVTVDLVENGTWVTFDDYGFHVCLPSDWNVLEITEEAAEVGIIFSCQAPDSERSFTIAYNDLEAATDIETIAADLAATHENVNIISINGIPYATYDIVANDVIGIVALSQDGTALYQFVFYPSSDSEFAPLAVQIAASIYATTESTDAQ